MRSPADLDFFPSLHGPSINGPPHGERGQPKKYVECHHLGDLIHWVDEVILAEFDNLGDHTTPHVREG